jgi:hypothetical protein
MGSNLDFLPENYRTGVILRVFEQKTRRKSCQTGENSRQIENFLLDMKCDRILGFLPRINFVHLLIFQSFAIFGGPRQTPDGGEISYEIPDRLPKICANGIA